jgi:hypothetical protein
MGLHSDRTISNKDISEFVEKCGIQLTKAQLRAWLLSEDGCMSKANKALTSTSIATDPETTKTTLRKLHPKRLSAKIRQNNSSSHTGENEIVSADNVLEYFRNRPKKTSPGISHVVNEHILQLLNIEYPNTVYLDLITEFINTILAGGIPNSCVSLLSASILIPLLKNDQIADSIRPIAMGDTYRKASASLLFRKLKNDIMRKFGNDQCAVGFSSGSEYIYQCHMLVNQQFNGDLDFVALDASNAFNSIKRDKVFAAMEQFPIALPYLETFYGSISNLFYKLPGDKLQWLSSEEGVQQGDPIGSFAFSLAIHDLLLSAKSKILNGIGIIKGFADDITSQTNTIQSLEIVETFVQQGPTFGFIINPKKSKVILPFSLGNDERNARKALYAAAFGLAIDDCEDNDMFVDGTNLLGFPFGAAKFVDDWFGTKMLQLNADLKLIAEYPDYQRKWNFFHWTFKEKITHLLHAMPYSVIRPYLEGFHHMCFEFLGDLVGSHLTPTAITHSRLPQSRGGFGIGFDKCLCHSAYLSCIAKFYSKLPLIEGNNNDTLFFQNIKESFTVINQRIRMVSENEKEMQHYKELLTIWKNDFNLSSFVELEKVKSLQHKLYDCITQTEYEAFVHEPDISREEEGRRLATTTKDSGKFLYAIPKGDCRLSSQVFQTALANKLGLQLPFITNEIQCNRCAGKPNIDKKGSHLNSCKCGSEKFVRHNAMVDTIKSLACSAGIQCVANPRNCFPISIGNKDDQGKIPDLLLYNTGHIQGIGTKDDTTKHLLADVQFIDPTLKTHLDNKNAAHNWKKSKYDKISKINNYNFIPIIVDTYGNFKNDTKYLIDHLISKANSRMKEAVPGSHLAEYWYKRLSCIAVRLQAEFLYQRYHHTEQDQVKDKAFINDDCNKPHIVNTSIT